MKTLKKVGFFRELSYGEKSAASLHDSIGKLDNEKVERIKTYLRSGELFIASPGFSEDILCESRPKIGPLGILTDGKWAWPTDLAFFVDKYRVALPKEFLLHMERSDWKIGPVDINKLRSH